MHACREPNQSGARQSDEDTSLIHAWSTALAVITASATKDGRARAAIADGCFAAAALLPLLAALTWDIGVALIIFVPLLIAACLIAAALDQHWHPDESARAAGQETPPYAGRGPA